MKVKLRKVGNSYTLTVPREYVSELGMDEGSEFEVLVAEDRVVYKPVADTWDSLRDKLRTQAESRGITDGDVEQAVKELRRARTTS